MKKSIVAALVMGSYMLTSETVNADGALVGASEDAWTYVNNERRRLDDDEETAQAKKKRS